MDKLRGLVRPCLTLSGWLVLLVGVILMLAKHADAETAKTILLVFIGAINIMIGFWFGERKKSQ